MAAHRSGPSQRRQPWWSRSWRSAIVEGLGNVRRFPGGRALGWLLFFVFRLRLPLSITDDGKLRLGLPL
jgi:hypothetical protein